MIRVLLVDDQELVRTGLRGILREAFGFDVVGECADGREVPAAVQALVPDVVLMDVRMPVVDGVQATRELRRLQDSPPVLALTTFDDEEVLAGMLRAGAAGFVLKGVPAEDLQRAVRAVAEGGAWLDPAVTARVLAIYRSAARGAGPGGQTDLDALTSREREVLALIGRGKTNGEIAAELFVSEGTVKTHINHVFTKLRLRDRAGRGAVQRPGQRGKGGQREQPPGVDPGRVHEQRGERQRDHHDGGDLPVVADHEVVPERPERLQRPHHQPVTPSVSDQAVCGSDPLAATLSR